MMKGSGMACPAALMFAFVILIFTVSTSNEPRTQNGLEISSCLSAQRTINPSCQMSQDYCVGAQDCKGLERIKSCVSPHQEGLLSLNGTFCNKELFTQDLCNDVNEVVSCLTRYNVSERCFADSLLARARERNFSCTMSDFQEKCSTTSFTESVTTDSTTASTTMGTTTLRTTPSSTRETPSTTTTSTVTTTSTTASTTEAKTTSTTASTTKRETPSTTTTSTVRTTSTTASTTKGNAITTTTPSSNAKALVTTTLSSNGNVIFKITSSSNGKTNDADGAVVTRTYLALLLVFTILLMFIFM